MNVDRGDSPRLVDRGDSPRLVEALRAEPYRGYTYAYPHKTAYRAFDPPRPLADLWREEDRSQLLLYVHVPVCEMRCGFCNLFTTVGTGSTDGDFESRYVAALEREAARVRDALGPAAFRGAAIGGGTPTYFAEASLARILAVLGSFGASPAHTPTSVETSPRTASREKLALLRDAGATRVSIGVQSFDEAETRALGRAQKAEWVEGALDAIRAAGFPVLNVDLMFGLAGQDERSLLRSIDRALLWQPEEIYLYPLYVRPLTGLGRRGDRPGEDRLRLHRAARERLDAAGYEAMSLRFFRRRGAPAGLDTCCQEDGTVGLGCGARSYTRRVHYASDWAVGAASVRSILETYLAAPDAAFDVAAYGVELTPEEERRRYVLKTLLRKGGLPLDAYEAWFGSRAEDDFPELRALALAGLAERGTTHVALTDAGLELSDAIGPMLYSADTRAKMAAFDLR
jgi:oxygen-independent coproporphyrinogen-3 oxidase